MIDHIIFNLQAGRINEVKLNVYIKGEATRQIMLPITDFYDKDFFTKAYETAKEIEMSDAHKYACEVCGANRSTFLRRYAKKWFCGFCGTHYNIVDEKLVLVAKV